MRHAQCPHQGASIGRHNGRFTCGIHLAEQGHIGLGNDFYKVFKAVAGAGVAVRLKRQHQAPPRKRPTCRSQGGRHFHRVMAVVINQGEHTAACGRHIAVTLKAPTHTFKFSQCPQQCGVVHIQFGCHRNGGQSIEHIVAARQIEDDFQIRQHHAVAAVHGEVHLRALRPHIDRADLRTLLKTVAGDRAGHLAQNVTHGRIVGTQNSGAVKRHAVQKIYKRLLELAKVVAVSFHVVGVDIGYYGHHR